MAYVKLEDVLDIIRDENWNFAGLINHIEEHCPTADVAEVVRCGQCEYAEELDKHCEINRNAYKHCSLWRGDEMRNVWHKYKKYYRDYSIVEADGFCSDGRRRDS